MSKATTDKVWTDRIAIVAMLTLALVCMFKDKTDLAVVFAMVIPQIIGVRQALSRESNSTSPNPPSATSVLALAFVAPFLSMKG